MAQAKRPGPGQWLRYAVGGGLPEDLREWVLQDTTGRTWALRHIARSLIYIAPLVVVILIFLPGPFWIRGLAVIGGAVMTLIYSAAYLVESTERRLLKAGYPPGMGESIRRKRSEAARDAASAKRRARLAERQAKARR